MVLDQTKSKLVGIIALAASAVFALQGCSGEAPLPPVETSAAPTDATNDVVPLARATMHVANGQLTIDEVTPAEVSPGVMPDGFGPTTTGKALFRFATGLVGNGTGSCTPAQFCAQITITNQTGRVVDNVFVEITNYFSITPPAATPSWGGSPVGNSTAFTSAFKNPMNVQAATIGSLGVGSTNTQEYKWNNGGATVFSYNVQVLGSFRRTSISGTFQQRQAAVDACAIAGHSGPILVNQDDAEANLLLPFAYTFYDNTYDRAVIGSNGYFLPYKTGSAAPTIPGFGVPNGGSTPKVGTYIFWDDLEFDSGNGVCTAVQGTTPNRVFTVTWKNARINPIQPAKPATTMAWGPQQVTYSFQIREQSDQGALIYNVPTGGITNLTRGSSATAGELGVKNGSLIGQLFILNGPSPYLPADPTAYTTKLLRGANVGNP